MSQTAVDAAAFAHSTLKELVTERDGLLKRASEQDSELNALRARNKRLEGRLAMVIQIIGGLQDDPENVTRLRPPFIKPEAVAG